MRVQPRHRARIAGSSAVVLAFTLGACSDPQRPSTGPIKGDAAPAALVTADVACEREVEVELLRLLEERGFIVTAPELGAGHMGTLIERACRKFPVRSAEKNAEWVFRCSAVGAANWLEGIEIGVSDPSAAPVGTVEPA